MITDFVADVLLHAQQKKNSLTVCAFLHSVPFAHETHVFVSYEDSTSPWHFPKKTIKITPSTLKVKREPRLCNPQSV